MTIKDDKEGSFAIRVMPSLRSKPVEKDGKVLVNMGPSQRNMVWESALDEREQVDLTAPDVTGWVEAWRAEVSPIWNMEQTAGINVVHRKDPAGFWSPVWRPWPGETVNLRITRPEAVKGSTFTVDTSQYFLSPGKHATDVTLTFSNTASQTINGTLTLDETTKRNLELFQTLSGGRREGTLIHLMDRARTAMGGRCLRRWLAYPLRDPARIEARVDGVGELVRRGETRRRLRDQLKAVHDLERLAGDRRRIGFGEARAGAARVLPQQEFAGRNNRAFGDEDFDDRFGHFRGQFDAIGRQFTDDAIAILCWITRSNRTWASRGISPISSSINVP